MALWAIQVSGVVGRTALGGALLPTWPMEAPLSFLHSVVVAIISFLETMLLIPQLQSECPLAWPTAPEDNPPLTPTTSPSSSPLPTTQPRSCT